VYSLNHFVGIISDGNNNLEINKQIQETDPELIIKEEAFQVIFSEPITEADYYTDEHYTVIVNGEVYNLAELQRFTGAEDPHLPVQIALLFQKQHTDTFQYLRGKFTVLIWDKQHNSLIGARDGFGVKPLFYTVQDGNSLFSSSKKNIIPYLKTTNLNHTALQQYLSYQFVPEPMTMTAGISLIEPGTYFVKKQGSALESTKYWQPDFQPILTEKNYWIGKIREVMYDSVEKHMGQDHSIGSFLSGGIDSTIIASLAKQIKPDLKTFSVGFAREGFSEVDVAKETAEKLGVENIAYTVSPEEYVEKLPEIMWHLDDPLADAACVPLYFVSRQAKEHVDIALSGEGADELFAGYNIYREPTSLKMFDYIPKTGKRALAELARHLPENMRGKSFIERGTTLLRDRYIGNAKMFEEVEKSILLTHYNKQITYQDITSPLFEQVKNEPLEIQMQYIDIHTWLPGDILLKAEKMSGANQLNVRMPFLDKEVFALASKIPINLKIANGTTKAILREAARGIIPEHVLDRRKLGFPVPIRHWLKNELHSWATRLIKESETDIYINKKYVEDLLEAHCKGEADYSRKIWTVLMFMLWHQIFVEKKFDVKELSQLENDIPSIYQTI
jgi:asparagine synthase (glutamine-hydrolysing)